MMKIDGNDKKILHELDTNSRQSLQSIGRKVGLHKNVVLHRVKKLEEKNIIKNYFTIIDSSKMGFRSYRLNLQFQNTTDEIIHNFISHFVNYKNTWWVVSTKGKYDFSSAIWVKNIKDFQQFWEQTLNKYHNYIRNQNFSLYLELFTLRHSYLMPEEYHKSDRSVYEIAGGSKSVKTDEIDYQILQLMANNSRIPTIDIAKKLDVSTPTIRKRVRNLTDLGVIKGFRINIDYAKMGYHMFKIDVYLNDYSKRNVLLDFILRNPYLIYISKTLGYADIEFDLIVENETQIHNILESINNRFPDLIRYYDFIHEYKVHKLDYMPVIN